MKRILWKVIGIGVFALAGVGSVNLGIWVADRDPPIIYEDAKALSPSVEQGGTIEIEFSVFRTRICPLIAKRWLTDSAKERHNIPQFTTGLRLLAGRETYRRSITVPQAAAAGPAEYRVTLEYVCNPLQKFLGPIVVTSPPVRFTVLPGRFVVSPPA
ncbi:MULTISPECIES: hypothetical protein [Agrobacterium]|uniref:hypothetical protein n=1 Tax=Agrobacterium TaxID=357 RepID=UPI002300BD57|nr:MULTISPECIES: hypothetical protein [Agrobacterium]MDA5627760.1 hypothetical protein [Agrobacterium sp. ST15.16.055]MDA6978492.1 hypothetical protein [Agrobacterium salinitolerans]